MNSKVLEGLGCADSSEYLKFIKSLSKDIQDIVITYAENLSAWYDFVDTMKCGDYDYVSQNLRESPEIYELFGFNSETKYLLFYESIPFELQIKLEVCNGDYFLENSAYNKYIKKVLEDERDRLLCEIEDKKKAREDELYHYLNHGFFG